MTSNAVRSPSRPETRIADPTDAAERVRRLAQLAVALPGRRASRLVERLRQPQASIDATYERLAEAPRELVETSRSAEWLLDNHYIVRRALRLLREGLPQGFDRRLPRLTTGSLRGLPRVYALAIELAMEQAHLDLPSTLPLLREFQALEPLRIAEAWALPATLRLVVIERLASVLDAVVPTVPHLGMDDQTVTVVVASCIRDLRALDTTDWKQFVESFSAIEAILRRDPAGIYPRMDFETRDRYRKAVEELARGSPRTEVEVADEVLALARAAGSGRGAHVGFHLIDTGRIALQTAIRYRAPWAKRIGAALGQRPTAIYVGGVVLLTLALLLGLTALAMSYDAGALAIAATLLLAIAPASTVAVGVINTVITHLVAPAILPKMDFESGLPAEAQTLVAVPSLITSPDEIATLVRDLEIRYLANRDPHLHFALLTDLGDAEVQYLSADDVLVEDLAERIRALNTRHGSDESAPFHLLHRPRRWSASEQCWMGWERKRGKLAALNRFLAGATEHEFSLQVGDATALAAVRYVITLDADTELPRGSANRLVATLAHPLNRAEFDPNTGAVVAGYTVLQPRIEISPLSAGSTFSRLFSNSSGLDPYTHAVSDTYQDLFAEGIFAGKGIYDVAAFARSIEGRIPDATLLSHDLFEGIHGRAALVTDTVFIEDYPDHYLAYARRLHRWARGDWQLLPWLGRNVPLAAGESVPTRLSLISRWKILDNLRRTLVAPSLLAFLVVAWTSLPGPLLLWTALAALVPTSAGLLDATLQALTAMAPTRPADTTEGARQSLRQTAAVGAFELVFLPHQAAVLCDAVVRTLWRVYVSRARLLEWKSAAHTARGLGGGSARLLLWREMAAAPATAVAIALLLWSVQPASLLVAAPLLALWLASPEIAERISLPLPRTASPLDASETFRLRLLARRTWSFFETFSGPEDQWLPPDHLQEEPRGAVAHRTSPTNIGLLLLSTLAAYDFGYRGLLGVTLRLKNTFDTLDRMERYRGHFLNWYATVTLEPLLPRYVSTVDSGNLAGCLVTVRESCEELAERPLVDVAAWEGLLDTVGVLRTVIDQVARRPNPPEVAALERHLELGRLQITALLQQPEQWAGGVATLNGEWRGELDRQILALMAGGSKSLGPALLAELHRWSGQVHQHFARLQREMNLFAPWLEALRQPPPLFAAADLAPEVTDLWARLLALLPSSPTLHRLPSLCANAAAHLQELDGLLASGSARPADQAAVAVARDWIATLGLALVAARQMADYARERLDEIRERADRLVRETDFSLLYDRRRRLFHIGFDVAATRLDDNHYDLLASEARLASFIAIAKGDVPEEHWLHLSRPIGSAAGERALLSWSGTMFEYLMPTLLLREGEDTLIGLSCRAAVREQIAYAEKRGIPWGISESGYARVDAQQNYQYRAFGVPSLGFRRDHQEELVVSPYASVLALSFAPRAVMENLETLQKLGMAGPYGLYEAVDFTWSRLQPGRRYTIVRSFMAHHQGMILATLDNFLHQDPLAQRFHRAAMARTAELLLYERPARQAPVEQAQPPAANTRAPLRARIAMGPWSARRDASRPQVHVLSNGHYNVLLTAAGAGASTWEKRALTRWTPDPTLDGGGFRLYVRDAEGAWATTVGDGTSTPRRDVHFHPHKVEYHAHHGSVSVRQAVTVAPGADVEIHYLTFTNEADRPQRLLVAGYGEVVLQDAAADRRHLAFSKLFVESEFVPELNALLFRRRPREVHDEAPYLLHMLVLPDSGARRLGYETSREHFLGRGGSVYAPAALAHQPPAFSATTGATLDPVMALAAQIDLQPSRSRHLAYVTLVAESRDAALALAASYRSLAGLEWTFELARTQCEAELERLNLDAPELATVEDLLSLLLYPQSALRAAADQLERNIMGHSGLWRFAISGDLPILLVRLHAVENATFLHEILRAQSFWRGRGIAVDVVVLNERATGYSADLTDRVGRAVASAGVEGWLQRPGGIFVVHADQVTENERALLLSAARVVLDADAGSVREQVTRVQEPALLPPLVTTSSDERRMGVLERPRDLLFDNGMGGFSPDGREYVIHLETAQWTPAPWVNVIANPSFGCVVTESGGGYTWAENSGENRLTPWSNDPVADTPGEALYLRDEETGAVWSPTLLPAGDAAAHQIHHGAGYSQFRHCSHDLLQVLRVFVAVEDPVKIIQLELTNQSERGRRVTATQIVEWVLGSARDGGECSIVPSFDNDSEALLARNPWNEDFGERVAFLAAGQQLHGFTADRSEFFGALGRRELPAALRRVGLANRVHPGLDPCAALQVHIDLAPGETKSVHFLLGQGRDRDEALRLVRAYRSAAAVDSTWDAVQQHWDRLLDRVAVRTPEPALDLMLNRWLLYQTLSSRVWGRTGFYQSGGGFGFRDQLQDVAALVYVAPEICRAHLLEAARHQFEAGDVLHWWHPPGGAGVRTRCSDDLLWLPFVTAHYVANTGDVSILSEEIPFLRGEPLQAAETERYGRFASAGRPASLFEHCLRAFAGGPGTGAHGLPLFGSGDWNDGMNRVGLHGRGESVWLAWFRHATLSRFALLCEETGEAEQAARLRREAETLRTALEASAWDGAWYRRGYYDDGSPLGSAQRDACRIDAVAQSWAVLSDAADPSRGRAAMDAVRRHLLRPGLVLLFTPPFDGSDQDPGYVAAYPRGVRENGGQYTHAAVWTLWALLDLGEVDLAERLFGELLSIARARTPEDVQRYRVEPYVLAADVYAEPLNGRGGWTWYTGSAGWAYRFGWEGIIGMHCEGGALRFDPCVPLAWPHFEVTLRLGATVYEIHVDNPEHVNRGVTSVVFDGMAVKESVIPRIDDGHQHRIEITLGSMQTDVRASTMAR